MGKKEDQMKRKGALLGIVLITVLAIIWLTKGQDLSLAGLRGQLAALEDWRAAHAIPFAVGFFALYIGVTALSLPFAVWMTLAAGAMFGLFWGLVIVSFASTLGGMLAATVVYVNAGTQLGQLDSLSGIASPTLLASFALLGLFPWIARGILGVVKRRKVYARWRRPARFDRNLVVIGAGAAGLVSSYIAAAAQAKVTLVEQHKMGGDCLNYGCVPSKALLRSAN